LSLQKFLEQVQPNYLYTYPSIIAMLDLSKLTELIDIRSVGEVGATSYSAEETGTIALECPDHKGIYHIMENIIVETDPAHGALITDLTNPLIRRYAIGDHVELGTGVCECGRTLSTITRIHGRVRNMLVLPTGDRIWPTIGEPKFLLVTNKIQRHQAAQKILGEIELRLQVREALTAIEESNLLNLVKENIGYEHLEIRIIYVDEFPVGKFEAFKCEIS
jgi:phenylacetate-CoA ligase